MAFLSPVFLFAAAVVGIPLWLHLSRRRKYREIQVGTLRFLRQALRQRRKKSRLEEIPLLLLRMAALALLAFAFARPVWPRSEKLQEKEAEMIILLDASGSMTADMAEEARASAKRAMAKAGTAKVKLAQFADEVQPLDFLESYRPIAGAPTRVETALAWALDQWQLTGQNAGKVVLISHLAVDNLPSQPPRVWPPQMAVELIGLKPPSVDNAAVRQISLLTPYVAEKMEIEASVALPPGRMGDQERTVTLEAEGVRETAVLPPGSERVVFRFHPPRPEMRGWISVTGGDAWPADDRRPFAVRWAEPARILLVDGQPGSSPFDGQAYFIEKALSASGAAHGKSPFKPEIVFALEGKSGPVDLSGVRAIALCGVTEFPAASARVLTEFVARGGGLVSVLQEGWTPGATAALVAEGLFPDAVTLTGGEEKRVLASWDRAHPALADFDGQEGGDLRELEWRDGFDARAGNGWRALATLDGGHPLLLEKENANASAGRVLVCAHPLTRQWTEVPREALFVPLIKNLFTALGRVKPIEPAAPTLVHGMHETRPIGIHLAGEVTEVVVPDSREALIATASEESFRSAFGLPMADQVAVTVPAPAEAAERSRPGELWPWLLVALLLILAAENMVATRSPKTPMPSP